MGFFKGIVDAVGGSDGIAGSLLSGIPYVGEGFAAAQQRTWATNQATDQRNFDDWQANRAMNFSAEEAEKQRQWQEKMSNSAYQRQADDLAKAGYNPILGLKQGASTPSGAVGMSSAGKAGIAAGAMGSGAKDAAALVKSAYRMERAKAKAEKDAIDVSKKKQQSEKAVIDSQLGAIKAKADYEKKLNEVKNPTLDYYSKKVYELINAAGGAFGMGALGKGMGRWLEKGHKGRNSPLWKKNRQGEWFRRDTGELY